MTDSVTGTKKMAIGHHIGDRAHIIEKEQNLHTGDREEREDFINLDEVGLLIFFDNFSNGKIVKRTTLKSSTKNGRPKPDAYQKYPG